MQRPGDSISGRQRGAGGVTRSRTDMWVMVPCVRVTMRSESMGSRRDSPKSATWGQGGVGGHAEVGGQGEVRVRLARRAEGERLGKGHGQVLLSQIGLDIRAGGAG